MIKGFKEFISRGNMVDLAVGVVIGGAFGAVITSFTNDILMAIIGAIIGQPNFNSLTFALGDATIAYGKFLTALLNFVLIAASVYFFVVVPMNKMAERRANDDDDVEPTNEEKMVSLLEQIASK
jgi:large conductance mechanosensitive channel